MSPEGTPIQVNENVLQAAASQNATGRLNTIPTHGFTGIVNTSAVKIPLQKTWNSFSQLHQHYIEFISSYYLRFKERYFSGNVVTVMSPEGQPIQMNAMALQAAAAQNATGMLGSFFFKIKFNIFNLALFNFITLYEKT